MKLRKNLKLKNLSKLQTFDNDLLSIPKKSEKDSYYLVEILPNLFIAGFLNRLQSSSEKRYSFR